jgi:hypothetical protein
MGNGALTEQRHNVRTEAMPLAYVLYIIIYFIRNKRSAYPDVSIKSCFLTLLTNAVVEIMAMVGSVETSNFFCNKMAIIVYQICVSYAATACRT